MIGLGRKSVNLTARATDERVEPPVNGPAAEGFDGVEMNEDNSRLVREELGQLTLHVPGDR